MRPKTRRSSWPWSAAAAAAPARWPTPSRRPAARSSSTPWPTCSRTALQGSLKNLDRRVRRQGRRAARAAVRRLRRLQEGDRLPRPRRRGAPDHARRLPPAALRVRRRQGRQRLHGEVVRRRRARRAPAAGRPPRCRRRRTSRWPSASCGGTRRPGRRSIQRIHDGAIGDVHTLRIYRVHGPVHCPRAARGRQRAGLPASASHLLQLGFRRVLHRLALPQRRRGLLGQERLARLGPGHGRPLLPRGGQPLRPLHGRIHVRRRRQALRLLAAHDRLLGDLRRLRPRLEGLGRDHDQPGRARSRRSTRARRWSSENLVWQYGRARLQPVPCRMAGAAGRHPPGQAAQRGPPRRRGRPGRPDGPHGRPHGPARHLGRDA